MNNPHKRVVANATQLLKMSRSILSTRRFNAEAWDYLNRAIRLLESVTTKKGALPKESPKD